MTRRNGIGCNGRCLGVGAHVSCDNNIDRYDDLPAAQEVANGVELVTFEQRVADFVTRSGKEGETHAAADEKTIDLWQQALDDRELVRDLRPTEHDDIRTTGLFGQLPENLDLAEHEITGRMRQSLRDVVDAGVLAMNGAERVIDVTVRESRQLVRESAPLRIVFAGLARVEAHVLEQRDVGAAVVAFDVVDERHWSFQQLTESIRHRP